MIVSASEDWVEGPLRRFVAAAGARYALLMRPTGQVLGQYGFTHRVDVMGACALASAINAASAALGRELDGTPFRVLHYAGQVRQIFLAEAEAPRSSYVFLTVFDRETSLGIVQLYYRELAAKIAQLAPTMLVAPPPISLPSLEQALDSSLSRLFGRPPGSPNVPPPPSTS